MITLVTGGARAGKSRWVLDDALGHIPAPAPLAFLATAQALDDEMRARIDAHKAERGPRFFTVEEPLRVPEALLALAGPGVATPPGGILVDCLTLWVSNLLFSAPPHDDDSLLAQADALAAVLPKLTAPVWLVSNEVGLGIVPMDPLTRRYRDALGRCNQRVAAVADRVAFVVAGYPLWVKGR